MSVGKVLLKLYADESLTEERWHRNGGLVVP